LAVQKPKKAKTEGQQPRKQESTVAKDAPQEGAGKRKRRRRNKATAGTADDGETDTAAAEVTMAET
jgi:U3 small nucleolar RNA-associated protein 23